MLNVKEVVTSRQNPTVKRICSLADKKGRRAEGLFRFDGIKLFREALDAGLCIRYVVLREDISREIEDTVARALEAGSIEKSALLAMSEAVFDKISEERAPEGIISVAELPRELHRVCAAQGYEAKRSEKLLVAEALRDPGNLGTVIRSAAALGIDRLLLSDDCVDLYNPKTVRAAMGGLFKLKIDTVPAEQLPDAIRSLREDGRKVYAAALHTEALELGSFELRQGDCFVIGNEGHGLSKATVSACDACAIIPMREGSESLNAAAAAAICIWETVKASR